MTNGGTIDSATIAMHELFESYIRAGFARHEALELIKAHISNLDSRPPGKDSNR